MRKYPLSCTADDFRPLLAAGHFFPEDKQKLSSSFDTLFSSPTGRSGFTALAAMVPHGAIKYAGSGLTWSLQQLPLENTDMLVVLAQVHREMEDTIWLPDYSGFKTPFGPIKVSREKIDDLAVLGEPFRIGRIPFEEEPCFDMILSALIYLGFDGYILPVLFGSDSECLIKAGLDLLTLLGPACLPVISVNCMQDNQNGKIKEQCGKNLVKLLKTRFHASPDRWYHGYDQQYCAALWTVSDTEDAEKVRGKE